MKVRFGEIIQLRPMESAPPLTADDVLYSAFLVNSKIFRDPNRRQVKQMLLEDRTDQKCFYTKQVKTPNNIDYLLTNGPFLNSIDMYKTYYFFDEPKKLKHLLKIMDIHILHS